MLAGASLGDEPVGQAPDLVVEHPGDALGSDGAKHAGEHQLATAEDLVAEVMLEGAEVDRCGVAAGGDYRLVADRVAVDGEGYALPALRAAIERVVTRDPVAAQAEAAVGSVDVSAVGDNEKGVGQLAQKAGASDLTLRQRFVEGQLRAQ